MTDKLFGKKPKYNGPPISVDSLGAPDKEGFITKQGGNFKSWKRRWLVLKGDKLYYFKTKKDGNVTGVIDITRDSFVRPERKKESKFTFAVGTSRRVFFMYTDNQEEMDGWINKLQQIIDRLKSGGQSAGVTQTPVNPVVHTQNDTNTQNTSTGTSSPTQPNTGHQDNYTKPAELPVNGYIGPREKIAHAKTEVPFLRDKDSKTLEFWNIWAESIAVRDELSPGTKIDFEVSTSADMQKLTWRVSGPQNIFIQKMVDFFWNVGAPESEIDRLNDVGALINPICIGSWIDMSHKGGMDGGWFFPVDIPVKYAIESSDVGEAIKKFTDWAEAHGVVECYIVGRDMGAAPPRQTEIRFKVPGASFQEQYEHAMSAFSAFDIPAPPEQALEVIRSNPREGLAMSVITSSEGFVRVGLLAPKPDAMTVEKLCSLSGALNSELLHSFERSLGINGPEYAEYQYLSKGFGYGVYKEGFDVVFHYKVGEEIPK